MVVVVVVVVVVMVVGTVEVAVVIVVHRVGQPVCVRPSVFSKPTTRTEPNSSRSCRGTEQDVCSRMVDSRTPLGLRIVMMVLVGRITKDMVVPTFTPACSKEIWPCLS